MGQIQHGRSRHGRGSGAGRGVAGIAIAAIVLVVIGGVVGFLVGRAGAPTVPFAPSSPTAPSAPSEPHTAPAGGVPTVLAQVTRVATGDAIMVRVTGSPTEDEVRVLGLDAPDLGTEPGSAGAQCGSREALAAADQRLTGQTVTLVPDPTVPERDERGARLAYVVLRSQLNYTDAALRDGLGRADTSRPLWYADVFAGEQAGAVAANRGIWGAPCDTTP